MRIPACLVKEHMEENSEENLQKSSNTHIAGCVCPTEKLHLGKSEIKLGKNRFHTKNRAAILINGKENAIDLTF